MINDLRENIKETLIYGTIASSKSLYAFLIVAMLKKPGILEFVSIKEY